MIFVEKEEMPVWGTGTGYHRSCPINGADDPIRVAAGEPLHYADMVDYIRAWPDKLVSFVAGRLCEDGMEPFARGLYEYICYGDSEGPDFEEWRRS